MSHPTPLNGLRVFLTGHTGFKGAWLTLLLREAGASVFGFALPPQPGGVFERAGVARHLAASTEADIRDMAALRTALADSGAAVVLHLAAQPLVRPSYVDPVTTYAVNVMGTVNLLEAVRHAPAVRAVVVVSSDKCYENREWEWGYREVEPMGGYDPYSNSKGCTELVTSGFRRSFFSKPGTPRLASARAGNVIGGGDWAADRLVPDLIRSLRAGQVTSIRNPHAIRPWQHVLDPLTGYVRLAESLLGEGGERFAEGWNFGPDASAERTVQDVVEGVCRRWDVRDGWRQDTGEHAHEATYLKLDSSKARHRLGWQARWNFDDALDQTVSWYQDDAAGADMAVVTIAQVRAHATRLFGG